MKKVIIISLCCCLFSCTDKKLETMKEGAAALLQAEAEESGMTVDILNIEPVKYTTINEDLVDSARVDMFFQLYKRYSDKHVLQSYDRVDTIKAWFNRHPNIRDEKSITNAFDSITREFDKVLDTANYFDNLIPVIKNRIAIRKKPKIAYKMTADVNANKKSKETGQTVEAVADRMTFYYNENLEPIDIKKP